MDRPDIGMRTVPRKTAPRRGYDTGGFGEAELRDAGSHQVFSSRQDLLDRLDQTPLAERSNE
jgi:hypothetical protein